MLEVIYKPTAHVIKKTTDSKMTSKMTSKQASEASLSSGMQNKFGETIDLAVQNLIRETKDEAIILEQQKTQ